MSTATNHPKYILNPQYTEEEQMDLTFRINIAFLQAGKPHPVIVPNAVVAEGMPEPAAVKPMVAQATKPAAPAKKAAAPAKKKIAATKNKAVTEDDKSTWPKVKHGEWDYVYICGGKFKGRFGYYDDHEKPEKPAMIYWDRLMGIDGPYYVPLKYLRAPPESFKDKHVHPDARPFLEYYARPKK